MAVFPFDKPKYLVLVVYDEPKGLPETYGFATAAWNAGVTTGVDTSQVSHTPDHTDACINALSEAGRRTVFAYSQGVGPKSQYPQDIRRLRMRFFSSDEQLLTLAMGGGPDAKVWALAPA